LCTGLCTIFYCFNAPFQPVMNLTPTKPSFKLVSMNKLLKYLFCLSLVLLSAVIFTGQALAASVIPPAPTLIAPSEKTVTGNLRPLIIGLTKASTSVKIFIDDAYNGRTETLNHLSGTANFTYKPAQNLSRGQHRVYVIAEDTAGNISLSSIILSFKIELPMPAPTLFKPVVNSNTSLSRPFVVGLAKNDSKIKVYIDKKYSGEFLVKNHLSGTANFAYKPAVLARGAHSVYTVATDSRGKESIWSNVINFSVKSSAIAQAAKDENKGAVANIQEPKVSIQDVNKSLAVTEDSGAVVNKSDNQPITAPNNLKSVAGERIAAGEQVAAAQNKSSTDELTARQKAIKAELENKINAARENANSLAESDKNQSKDGQGMINEGRENQSRLRVSLVIFILFLIGVVAWLIWVNRELVKERQTQNQTEDQKDNSPDAGSAPSAGQKDKLL
jgi:hypothetical protein